MALRVHIDGEWSAADFAAFYDEVHQFYEFAASRFRVFAYAPSEDDRMLVRMASLSRPLKVTRISYASPGFTDLAGLGAIVKELREFLQFLIVHFREGEDRKLNREEQRIRIAQARLDLLESLRAKRNSGDGEAPLHLSSTISEFIDVPKFDEFARAIFDRRISRVEETDEKLPD